jgi:hypothetical protein
MKPTKNPAAVALGRLGGSKNTGAQNAARRINGRKGGKPRKKTEADVQMEIARKGMEKYRGALRKLSKGNQ